MAYAPPLISSMVYKPFMFLLESDAMRCKKIIAAFWLASFCVLAQAEESSGTAKPEAGWSDTAQEILINALSLTGVKYKYGGKSPETGFDCSGFVRYVFQQAANLTLPHGARAISQLGQSIPMDQLQPGDLVFFNTLKSAFSHVGIYLGDGKFIHAPSSGGGIHVVDMNDSYWAKRFNGARRMPANEQPPTESAAE
jgi:cell wall-associated NlpC family hydrolase